MSALNTSRVSWAGSDDNSEHSEAPSRLGEGETGVREVTLFPHSLARPLPQGHVR